MAIKVCESTAQLALAGQMIEVSYHSPSQNILVLLTSQWNSMLRVGYPQTVT